MPKSQKPNLVSWAKCLNHLVPLAGIELATFALRIGKRTVCHDLKLDGQRALTTREIRDLMALQGQRRHV